MRALQRSPYRVGERCPGKKQGDSGHHAVLKAAAKQAIDGCARQRQQWNNPKSEIRLVHSFSKFTRSTLRVSRARKTAIMMARPTAASAAATTMTKKTNTCPLRASLLPCWFQ